MSNSCLSNYKDITFLHMLVKKKIGVNEVCKVTTGGSY